MQSEVDNVAFRVGRLKISREPKHRHKLKSETEVSICPFLDTQ